MRRSGLRILVALAGAAVAASLVGLGAAAGAPRGSSERPALRLLGMSPLTVRGVHFKPGEKVRLVAVVAGSKLGRSARAGVAGSFTVTFGEVPAVDPCSSSLVVVARGSLGSAALLKLPPRMCVPLRGRT